jgi:hypothetical protein
MILSKILKGYVEKGKRMIQLRGLGKNDVRTAPQIAPYGVDSCPIADVQALYCTTTAQGVAAVIGYVNKSHVAQPGEYRTYATDSSGEVKFYMYLKGDGTCEIGGNSNYAVKFNELKIEFNELKSKYNDLASKFNAHTHILTLSSGTGTAAVPANTASASTANIDNAKNDKIKTI